MPKEPGRLQLDIRDVPIEVIAALRLRAFENDTTLTAVCREALVLSAGTPTQRAFLTDAMPPYDDTRKPELPPWGSQ